MNGTDLIGMDALGLRDAVRDGELRAADIVDAHLARIGAVDERVGAFLEVWGEQARRDAEAVDRKRKEGRPLGALAGVPVALKDNFVRRGARTGCASRILEGFRAPYTATAVQRLEAAGAVLLGRTNMDEFAFGSSTEHSSVQRTHNPFDLERAPGGSSGGSAAAVAARMAPLALGSDTGGSVRQPAALCGVLGLKPTYGRISRYGLVAFASSLDHVAPFARSATDMACVLSVLAGHDPMDATSRPEPVPDYGAALAGGVAGLRIGIAEQLLGGDLDGAVEQPVRAAIDALEELGARVVPVTLPHAEHAIASYYLIANAEAATNLARYDGVRYGARASGALDLDAMYSETRSLGFGDEAVLRILLGTFALCAESYDAYYLQASKVRTLIRRDFEHAFAACDLIACPTSPMPAFRLGEKLDDPLQMYLCDVLTVPANLAGVPALSLPCGATDGGLPVGLQLIGPALAEETLLRAAAAYQTATAHHRREPAL